MDLREQDILGPEIERHWYYVAKGQALRSLLRKVRVAELLDVGAGSGVFARQLLDAGLCRSAVCVDPNYDQDRDERHAGGTIAFRRAAGEVTQDLILMIDVLEHVPDDCALLRSYTDRAPPGTLVVISVPAFQFLWSGHDQFLGHHRRYTGAQLEDLVRRAGLQPIRRRYFFGLLFPLISLIRLYDRWRLQHGRIEARSALKKLPRAVNAVLTWTHALERLTLFRINRLLGLSVFCVARRV